jgi:virulence-associated protein VapD
MAKMPSRRHVSRHTNENRGPYLAVIPGLGHNARWPETTTSKDSRMYAISFDLDTDRLKRNYHNQSYNNAYDEIRRILEEHSFTRQQGSVYFGDPKEVTAVTTVLAVQDLTQRLPWFAPSVSDIRMLRIEENNDLMPAIEAVEEEDEDEDKKGGGKRKA